MKFIKSDKLISGVEVKKLSKITTKGHDGSENGWLIDVLRSTDSIKKDGNSFSQVYVTVAYPGAVKGFHCHKKKIDLFCVVSGVAKLVLVDDRQDSPTSGTVNEFIMGDEHELMLVLVPPMVKHAFKNKGNSNAYIMNYMIPAHDPDNPDSYGWDGYEIE